MAPDVKREGSMSPTVRDQIAQINEVRDVLRLIAELTEVKRGAIRLASGATRAVIAFEQGHLTGAMVPSTGKHGVAALEQILKLPDAAFQFLPPSESAGLNKEDEICVQIKALLANNLSLTGLPTAPGQQIAALGGDNDPQETSAIPALKIEELSEDLCTTGEIPALFNVTAAGEDPCTTGEVPALFLEPAVESKTESVLDAFSELLDGPEPLDLNMTAEVPAFTKDGAEPPVRKMLRDDQQDITGPVPLITPEQLDATAEVPVIPKTPAVSDISAFSNPTGDYEDHVADKSFDSIIKRLSDEDDQSEFEKSESLLIDESEEALTPEQRILLEEMSKLHDKESFQEADPLLKIEEDPLALSEEKLEILEKIQVDLKGFDVEEIGPELYEERALTDDQKTLLEEVSKLADPDAFLTSEVKIENEGHSMTDEERWMLEQTAKVLSPEEQQAQFNAAVPDLQNMEVAELRPFVEPPTIETLPDTEFDVGALDAIPAAQVADGDFAPLIAPAAEPEAKPREASKGIIGRVRDGVWGKIAAYEGPRRGESQVSPEKIIGPIILVCLCISLFTIPGYLKKMMGGSESEAQAAEQMRQIVAEEMEDQVPHAKNDDPGPRAASSGAQGSTSGGGGGGGGSAAVASGPEAILGEARSQASKGWKKRAIRYYREYLALSPDSYEVRVEFIRYLLAENEKAEARQACTSGMKGNITSEQRQELWQLMRRCLID